MKQKKYTLLILLLVLLIVVLNIKPENKPSKSAVSIVQTSVNVVNKQSIVKKIQKQKEIARVKFDWLEGYDKDSDTTPDVGLIQAFREFKKIKRCNIVIRSATNGSDSYQMFLDYKNRKRPPNKKEILTLVQKDYFDRWILSCKVFMDFENEPYTAIHERYRKRFYQTKAITKIEKDFAKSWPLKEETRFINFKYDNLINGYDTSNKQLVKNMEKQLYHVKNMLKYIHINDDIEFSIRSSNEIIMYESQLIELEGIIDGSIEIDENYLVNLYQLYENNYKIVDDFLKQNISSDAFLTLAPIIFKQKNIELGFFDKRYYQSILPPVLQLFACSMDALCDPESKVMNKECFLSPYAANEQACGLTIEDYYLSYYFSPNQLTDVDQIINYFFENYVQN